MQTDQTFSNIVGQNMFNVGRGSVQTNETPSKSLRVSGSWARSYIVFSSRKRKCWTMLDETFEVEQISNLSSTVQHDSTVSNSVQQCSTRSNVMFKRIKHIQCVLQCWMMFDQHVWSISERVNGLREFWSLCETLSAFVLCIFSQSSAGCWPVSLPSAAISAV